MGLCSSSTCEVRWSAFKVCDRNLQSTYKKSSGNKDQDTTGVVGGLGVQAGDLVLDLLERQSLCDCLVSPLCNQ